RTRLTTLHQGTELPGFDLVIRGQALRAGLPSAPLPSGKSVLINYRGGPRTFPTVPYYRVLNGEIPPDEFRGKIVLVGATTHTLHDVFPTPFAVHGMPGVEIHANVLETLFQGIGVTRLPRWTVLALVLAAALGAVFVTVWARPLRALLLLAGVAVAYAGA